MKTFKPLSRRSDNGGGDQESLNFKVDTDFKREFKVFAAAHGLTMSALLREGFELSKKMRGE